jgi:hypothetical protein
MYLFKDDSSTSDEDQPEVTDLSLLPLTAEHVKSFTYSLFLERWVPIHDLLVFQTIQRWPDLQNGFPLQFDRVLEVYQHVGVAEITALIFSYEQPKYRMLYSLAWNYRDTYSFTSTRQLVKRELETTLSKINQWEKDYYLTVGFNHLDPCWDFYESFTDVRCKFKLMMECFHHSNTIEKIRWMRHGFVIFYFSDLEGWFVFYTSIDVFNFYPIF